MSENPRVLPVVALMGRPSVGKSTLFNGLTRTRDALVSDVPGVTRDRHYGVVDNEGRSFVLVDAGGLSGEEEGLSGLMAAQSMAAVEESDLVLFVVDARAGITVQDERLMALLRRSGKPFELVVNKTDGLDENAVMAEFSAFGVGEWIPTAAAHMRGIGQLLERVCTVLGIEPRVEEEVGEDENRAIRVAIVGRPNVGKSTLVNRLLGEERVVVSEVSGTTRDSIEVPLERDGRNYVLVDTAGVRRRARVEEAVEKISVIKTLQSIQRANVIAVMLDASEGVTDQDATLLGHVLESGRAFVVVLNKWDGLTTYQREQCEAMLDRRLSFAAYAERVFISAKHGSGLRELMRAINRAYASATKVLGTKDLTEALTRAYEGHQPPLVNGRSAKLRYAHAGGQNPPRIIIHGNRVQHLPDSYKRYLENCFRERFKLVGTPVMLEFRTGENPFEGKHNVLTERQQKKRQRLIRFSKRRK